MPFFQKITPAILCGAVLLTLAARSVRAAGETDPNPEKERELIAILKSEAPGADKALACKLLAIHGSDAAIPELARLLIDEQLASWARIALEVIPGPAADEALRKALDSTAGKLQVGAINSIGVRRDAAAVEVLTTRLNDQDPEVASAAAVALGMIGNAPATKSLRAVLGSSTENVRSSVAEGLILCAESRLAADDARSAVEIYDELRKADVPKQRLLEATRGAILARKEAGIPLLVETLGSNDKSLFYLALQTAREFTGKKVDETLAAQVDKAAPERAALIIVAMADRPKTVVQPAIIKAAGKGPKPVRLAAIAALARVGDASCLTQLMEISQDADKELAEQAGAALGELPGEGVNKEIVARLVKADAKSYPLLLDLVGKRLIEADSALLKAADHSDKNVRAAAFKALGKTLSAKNLGALISQVLKPKREDEAPLAQQALKAASIRMPDREACADQLAMALDKSPTAIKPTLLDILTDVGGKKALSTVAAAANSNDPQLQDEGSKLLGKWSSVDAAPVLLDLAKSSTNDKYHVRAIKGYIALIRRFATIPEPERVEMCQIAMSTCRHDAEKKVVLDVLKLYPSVGTLKMAVAATNEIPALKDDATQVTLSIAAKLGSKVPEVGDLLGKAGLEKVKIEIVKAEYGAGATQRDVTETVAKAVGDLQLVTLPSTSFNESFGGDPAPNAPKQLKVQYKINGKSGEATFAENALIILPMPK
jgi:HEAT repeat protein